MKELLAFEYLFQKQVPQKYIENFRRNNPQYAHWLDSRVNIWILDFLGSFCDKSPFMIKPPLESEDKTSIEKYQSLQAKAYEIYTKKCSAIFNNEALDQTLLKLTSGDEEAIGIVKECSIQFNQSVEKFDNRLLKKLGDEEYNRVRSPDYEVNSDDLDFYSKYYLDLKQYGGFQESLPKGFRKRLTRVVGDIKGYLNEQLDIEHKTQFLPNKTRLPKTATLKQEKISETVIPIFDSLFNEPYKSRIECFIDILRAVSPQVIANDNRWCAQGNKSGVMRLFLKLLKENKIIYYKKNRETYGVTVANKFPPLNKGFIDSQAADYGISDKYRTQLEPKIISLKTEILNESNNSSVNLR